MILKNLQQPPFNTSLIGVLQGAADFYGLDVSTPMLYGGTGHAFLMNIHQELCPSGPYVWHHDPFYRLAQNIGLDILHLSFFHGESKPEERATIESRVKGYLDKGVTCGCINLDHQMLVGYDEAGFILSQPWGKDCQTTPARLTFNSWEEFGLEVHAVFYAVKKGTPADFEKTVLEALRFAIDLYQNPTLYTDPSYAVGREAYANWIFALEQENFDEHGAWWNAMVWGECREMAARFLTEIAEHYTHDPKIGPAAGELAHRYDSIAAMLLKLSDKELPLPARIAFLKEAEDSEAEGVDGLVKLVNLLTQTAVVSLPSA